MAKLTDSNKRFLQVLSALALAAAPATSAFASALPAPAPAVHAPAKFAPNLAEKIAPAPQLAAKPQPGPYKQTFPDLYVQTTFTEIQPGLKQVEASVAPSQAFKLITRS